MHVRMHPMRLDMRILSLIILDQVGCLFSHAAPASYERPPACHGGSRI